MKNHTTVAAAIMAATLALPAAAQYDAWGEMRRQQQQMEQQRMHRERMQIEQEQLREMQEENEYRQREQLRQQRRDQQYYGVPPVPRIPPLGGY